MNATGVFQGWHRHRRPVHLQFCEGEVVSFCTYEVQDPAHGAVASAGQDSEVRNVSEEVQPAKRRQQRLLLLYYFFFLNGFINCIWKIKLKASCFVFCFLWFLVHEKNPQTLGWVLSSFSCSSLFIGDLHN